MFNKNKIYFGKIHDDAIIPTKRKEDGAYDIYTTEKYVELKSGEIHAFKTGLISSFNSKYRVVFKERGSTGSIGLSIRAGVIDSGFRGEWLVLIQNTSKKDIIIGKCNKKIEYENIICYPYNKAICQADIERVPRTKIVEKSKEFIESIKSKRQTGKFGSSGK